MYLLDNPVSPGSNVALLKFQDRAMPFFHAAVHIFDMLGTVASSGCVGGTIAGWAQSVSAVAGSVQSVSLVSWSVQSCLGGGWHGMNCWISRVGRRCPKAWESVAVLGVSCLGIICLGD